eukprot:TRINITY_DN3490_c0_g2_i7.p1 TRINITY_DN3490_c0_g2~~TRINITY_DN3490_c0_g2_i7.p1  ORF type:complete len:200 (-),score=32.96 TRINITY_DN3490_c0_g2_i7:44-643(-)
MAQSFDVLLILLVVGDSGVGKTALLQRFTTNEFNADCNSTIGIDYKTKTIETRGRTIRLQIWDAAGQEKYHAITKAYFRGARGVLVVYDSTNEESFQNVGKWIQDIGQFSAEETVKILVGNKSDLSDQRQVSIERAAAFAKENQMTFIETSARDGANVDFMMDVLAVEILGDETNKQKSTHAPEVTLSTQPKGASDSCC